MHAVLFLDVLLLAVVIEDFYGQIHLREVPLVMENRGLAPDLLASVLHYYTVFQFLLV